MPFNMCIQLVLFLLASAATAAATAAAATAAATSPTVYANCTDHETPEGVPCSEIPGVCTRDLMSAHLLCPNFCNLCGVYEEWKSLLLKEDFPCKDLAEPSACKMFGSSTGDCDSPLVKALCRETCARIGSFPCKDHVQHIRCPDLPGVCNHAYGVLLCPKFCHLCNASVVAKLQSEELCAPNCTDLAPEADCKQPGMCNDTVFASYLCPRTCFQCQSPSTTSTVTTPATTTTTPTTTTTTPTTTTTTPTTTTTTPTTTTTTPTTTTTTPTTTTTKAAVSLPGSQCVVCGDVTQGVGCTPLDLVLGQTSQCDDSTPYCMNDISQTSINGQIVVTKFKRCVNEADCRKLWFEGTSDQALCTAYDPNLSTDDVSCHLCCYGDQCNLLDVPPPNSWYHP